MARIASLLLLSLGLAACGSVAEPAIDGGGGVIDATPGNIDATPGVIDATPGDVDAMPQLPPTPSREIVGGAGRLTSGTYTFDVEIGHPVSQQPSSGATYTLEGNAAVVP